MKNKIKIRKAKKADIFSIVKLWEEYMNLHKKLDKHFSISKSGFKSYSGFIEKHLSNRDAYILVAKNNIAIIGFSASFILKYPPGFKVKKCGKIKDLDPLLN